MTEREFGEIIKKAREYYPRERFVESKDAFKTWYKNFEEMDFDKTVKALDMFARKSEFAPTVAGICKHYDAIKKEEDDFNRDINECYRNLVSNFGTEARDLFDKLIESDSREKKIQKARWLMNAGIREIMNDPDLTLEQFLKGVIK